LSPAQETAAIVSGWAEFATLRPSGGGAGADEPTPSTDEPGARVLSADEEATAIVRGWPNTR
jgi:hypothetical protein